MGAPEDLFWRFKREGFALIQAAENEAWEESYHRDFKSVGNQKSSLPTVGDKKNYAKALSGFANSAGGVVVWGVDCRSVDHGPDVVQGRLPIADPGLFANRLELLTPDMVVPWLEGVKHEVIQDPSGGGYVITLIPASEQSPHMACGQEQHVYFKRSGAEFLPMEHGEVEGAFFRPRLPKLVLTYYLAKAGVVGSGTPQAASLLAVVLSIHNAGGALARYVRLELVSADRVGVDMGGLNGLRDFGLPMQPGVPRSGPPMAFGGSSDHVVHPGSTIDVLRLNRQQVPAAATQWPDLHIEYGLLADGFSYRAALEIPGAQFLDAR